MSNSVPVNPSNFISILTLVKTEVIITFNVNTGNSVRLSNCDYVEIFPVENDYFIARVLLIGGYWQAMVDHSDKRTGRAITSQVSERFFTLDSALLSLVGLIDSKVKPIGVAPIWVAPQRFGF